MKMVDVGKTPESPTVSTKREKWYDSISIDAEDQTFADALKERTKKTL